jgi:hypothetical protein
MMKNNPCSIPYLSKLFNRLHSNLLYISHAFKFLWGIGDGLRNVRSDPELFEKVKILSLLENKTKQQKKVGQDEDETKHCHTRQDNTKQEIERQDKTT